MTHLFLNLNLLENLLSSSKSCRVYLCLTKCDLLPESSPSNGNLSSPTAHAESGQSSTPSSQRRYDIQPRAKVNLKELYSYATAIGASVHKTSSKTGEGVDDLFYQIAKDYLDCHAQFEMEQPYRTSKSSFYTIGFPFPFISLLTEYLRLPEEKLINFKKKQPETNCCF